MDRMKQVILNMSLRRKLTAVYLIAFFIPLICITTFAITRMVTIANEKSFQVRQTQCAQISANVSAKLNEYYKSLNSFSNNQIINHYFNYTYPDTSSFFSVYPSINTLITSFLVSNPQISSFTVFTDNPTFLTNHSSIMPMSDEVKDHYLLRKNLLPASLPILSDLETRDGVYYLALSSQVSSQSVPSHHTLLSIAYPETGIYSLYQHESSDFAVFLTAPDGTVISSSDRSAIGYPGRKHAVIQTAGNVPSASLTELDRKWYYTETFSANSILKGWNIYIEISNEQYLEEVSSLISQSLFLITAITLLGAALFILCSQTITRRLDVLVKTMSEIRSDDDLHVEINTSGTDEIGILSKNFKKMLERINRLILDVYAKNIQVKDLEIKHKQAELLALQSQINPHFLFNTMQSLSISSYNNNDTETAAYLNKFCSFLRDCLYWETKCVPLGQEIQVVENYLSLQKLRYEDKLNYEINIPSTLHHIPIPKFTLQPIVENAIEHGLWDTGDKQILIRVSAAEHANGPDIIVEDNGSGMEADTLARICEGLNRKDPLPEGADSIGIFNTNERLKLFYGPGFGIEIESALQLGTRVTIHIADQGGSVS